MSNSKKRAAVLFEAMSKAPTSQTPVRRGGFSWLRRDDDDNAAPLLVAEPLTEEEAAMELASERAAFEAERAQRETEVRDREARKVAKREAKGAKRAERAAKRAERRAARESARGRELTDNIPVYQPGRRQSAIPKGAAAILTLLAVVAGLILAGYALGRRSTDGQSELETITGIAGPNRSGSPLLPPDDAGRQESSGKTTVPEHPELSRLLEPPGSSHRTNAQSVQKPRTVANMPATTAGTQSQNYLQIDSFLRTRYHPDSEVREHLRDVRKFLAERNIQTVARRRSSGYVLFSETGFRMGSEFEGQREAFKKRIRELGQEYSRAGGRYSFKGCFFVSHSEAHRGPEY